MKRLAIKTVSIPWLRIPSARVLVAHPGRESCDQHLTENISQYVEVF